MIVMAIKMLVGDRLKYIGLLAGMAFAAMMIAQQSSIFTGLALQTGTFVRERSMVDLWVMDDQVKFSEDQVPVRDTVLNVVRGVEGVEWAVPLFKGWLKLQLPDGTRTNAIVVGIDDATLVGGPAKMVDGSVLDLRRDPGILVDVQDMGTKLALARSGGGAVKVGDRVSINDNDAEIVGTFKGEPSFFWDPIIFTTYSRVLRFAPKERNMTHYVLVHVREGADKAAVAARIRETTGLLARTGPEFEGMTRDYIMKATGILVNFGMAVGLGFIVGMISTGQTFFNFTLDNLRYFASLKAMGAGPWLLVRMVFTQVLVATLISFGLGLGIASLMGLVITKTDLAFTMPWQVPVFTLISVLIIGFLTAGLSLIKVLRLEPGVVFKS